MMETARMRSESPGTPGAQAADAADDEVDLHARRVGRVQLLDEVAVHQAVHLGDDARGAAGPRVVGLAPDAGDEAVAQPGGRHDEVVEAARPRVAGEQVEQLGEVLAEASRGR